MADYDDDDDDKRPDYFENDDVEERVTGLKGRAGGIICVRRDLRNARGYGSDA